MYSLYFYQLYSYFACIRTKALDRKIKHNNPIRQLCSAKNYSKPRKHTKKEQKKLRKDQKKIKKKKTNMLMCCLLYIFLNTFLYIFVFIVSNARYRMTVQQSELKAFSMPFTCHFYIHFQTSCIVSLIKTRLGCRISFGCVEI